MENIFYSQGSRWFHKHTPTSPSAWVVTANLVSPLIFLLLRYTFRFGLESTISISVRWSGPGPTLAVTMTSIFEWAWFHTHFLEGYRYAGRLNLMAVTLGRINRERQRKRKASDLWDFDRTTESIFRRRWGWRQEPAMRFVCLCLVILATWITITPLPVFWFTRSVITTANSNSSNSRFVKFNTMRTSSYKEWQRCNTTAEWA